MLKLGRPSFLTALMVLVILQIAGKFLPSKLEEMSPLYSHRPDILIVGSSAMATPIRFCDFPNATAMQLYHLQHPLCHPCVFEKKLSQAIHESITVYSIAAPGQDVEESDRLFNRLIKTKNRPAAVVLAVTPFSFLDVIPSFELEHPSVVSQLAPKVEGLLMFSTQRKLWQAYVHDLSQTIVPREQRFKLGIDDYKHLYTKEISADKLEALNRFLGRCIELKITAVVVNFPLAKENICLMRPHYHEHYLASIAQIAKRKFAPLIDLQNDKRFHTDDFNDPAHLNAQGADKMFAALGPQLRPILAGPKLANGIH